MMYTVHTAAKGPVAGSDSCIAMVPPGICVEIEGQAAVNVPALGRILRALSEDGAAGVGEALHHAEWVITGDPVVVEDVGMHGRPDCGRCRSAVDQALAYLAEAPGRELLVGTLYWAGS